MTGKEYIILFPGPLSMLKGDVYQQSFTVERWNSSEAFLNFLLFKNSQYVSQSSLSAKIVYYVNVGWLNDNSLKLFWEETNSSRL